MTATQACGGCAGRLKAPSRTLVVRSHTELSPRALWYRRYGAVCLSIPELDPAESARWEEALERAYTECGCTAGAYALLGAAGVSLVLLAAALGRGQPSLGSLLPPLAGFIVGSVIAGKLVGMLAGRVRVPILVVRLRRRLRSSYAR